MRPREIDTSRFPESALSTKTLVGHLNTLVKSGNHDDSEITSFALEAHLPAAWPRLAAWPPRFAREVIGFVDVDGPFDVNR